MLWLIYGTAGWIGGQCRELLNVAGQKSNHWSTCLHQ